MTLTTTDILPPPRNTVYGTTWWTVRARLRTSGRDERVVVVLGKRS